MSGLPVFRDYIRDAVGAGIDGASFTVKRLVDDVTVASGTTATDSDPATTIAGMFSVDETGLGYPGPIIAAVTDPASGAVRKHTSKSIGITGAWRSVDVTRLWRLAGTGVVPGIDSELAVSTTGADMVITVSTGEYLAAMGEHGLIYAAPAAQSVTADAADATQPRIDTVALRFYPPGVEQEGRVLLVLLKGTPASSPAAPGLTQNTGTVWEVALADVRVDATVTTLAVDKVTDRRTYCLLYPASITAGDTFYVDASGKLARLAKGTSGQFLKQGATIPGWATLAPSDVGTIPVANGGTGATDAATARTNLGVAIGTNVQAYDADLDAWAGKTAPSGTVVGTSDTQTITNKTLTAPTISSFANATHAHTDAASGGTLTKSTVGLGNVDNTSDATKNAATATLTNKTLTTPTIADFTNATHIHQDAASGGAFVLIDGLAQDAANVPSTTATSTYQVAISLAITLPAGTWSVRVQFDGRVTHGVSGNVSIKINVGGTLAAPTWSGGTLSAARTVTGAPSGGPGAPIATVSTIAGVTGGGLVNVFGGYVSSGGNTATMDNPRLVIDAYRTA